jgi:hypothetical protein
VNRLFAVLVVAVVVALWWAYAKPQAVFVVRIQGGRPAATQGKVTRAFLDAVADVFQEFGLEAGEIRGVPRERAVALWFSSGIPPDAQQRIRNWWGISGWSTKAGRMQGTRSRSRADGA